MCSPHRCGSRCVCVCVCVRKHSFAPTENDVMRVYNSFSGRNYVAVSTPPLWQQQPQRWRTKTFGFIEQQPIKIHLNLRYGVTIFCSFCCFTLKAFNWQNTSLLLIWRRLVRGNATSSLAIIRYFLDLLTVDRFEINLFSSVNWRIDQRAIGDMMHTSNFSVK